MLETEKAVNKKIKYAGNNEIKINLIFKSSHGC